MSKITRAQLYLCLLAASCGQGTYVVVSVQRGAMTPTTVITKLDLQLQLGTQMSSKSYTEANHGAITLPADLVLEIGSSSGVLTATATASDMNGNPVDQGVGTTMVARNKTVNLSITLGMTPGGTLLAAPTGVTVCRNNAQNSVFWPPVMGATAYNVYAGSAAGVTKTGTPVGSMVQNPPFRHTGLTNGTTYFYVVTTVNAAGESALVSNEVSATPEAYALPGNILYSANNQGATGSVYGWTSFTAMPNINPNMTLTGPASALNLPLIGSVFVDKLSGWLYVASAGPTGMAARRITVYRNSTAIAGATPSRTLQDGPLQNLMSLTVDTNRNILYFVNQAIAGSQIVAMANACNVAGNPAPPAKAIIAGNLTGLFESAFQIYLNEATDELYVANHTSASTTDNILVFKDVSTLNGTSNVAPTRTITIRDGTTAIILNGDGVTVDTSGGRNILYVSHFGSEPSAPTATNPASSIYVIDNASAATGLVTANRRLTGIASMIHPIALHVVENRLFVCNHPSGPNVINSWTNASTLTGSPAPTQTPMPAFTTNFTTVFYVP